jgi:acetoacetyl-CoA synthetase
MKPLWTPTADAIRGANLTRYQEWLHQHRGVNVSTYDALWKWSVADIERFWESVWHYFNILHDGHYKTVTNKQQMPGTRWFEGVSLNYAEHVFRMRSEVQLAIAWYNESGSSGELPWSALEDNVSKMQGFLIEAGIRTGDTVVAYLPTVPEATISFLAASSLGAIWSSCSPDFGTRAVADRFAQIKPKVLITADRYTYGGKQFDRRQTLNDLIDALPTVQQVVLLSDDPDGIARNRTVTTWNTIMAGKPRPLTFTRVPFNHPMWVLYSSGTTGLPKAIVHSQGGILLEQLKYGTFHNDIKPGERCFWFTTTGWMMWNYLQGTLLAGGTMVLYDGSPAFPDMNTLWRLIEAGDIRHFGTSAGFILAGMQAGLTPGKDFNLDRLRSIGSTGSTLPPEGFDWIYQRVKPDVWLVSVSGGTDICSAFVGGNPTLPVYAGEIQCRALGVCLEAYDENGHSVEDTVGEMVITSPMPSMPVYFWNDENNKRYRESYFESYPNVWRHGDWIRITPSGGIIIYGRSDATLNRGGVRIGTSEVYSAVATVAEIKDSLVICIERKGGQFWMPLFVVMQPGKALDDPVRKATVNALRAYSPRHVPDEIIVVPDIPYTLSGKKTETPVKNLLMGKPAEKVVNQGALRNPKAMAYFVEMARSIPT